MGKRKMYNTTMGADLLRELKILAARNDKRQNVLIEEAISNLLKNITIFIAKSAVKVVYSYKDIYIYSAFLLLI
jgi:hypothetical protein